MKILEQPCPFKLIRGISPLNVRQSDESDDLSSLKATIRAVGLINPLLLHSVRPGEGGGYLVLAGGRRWRALRDIEAEEPGRLGDIRVKVVEDASDAEMITLSTMENAQTLQMHPVRQYEAFAAIAHALPDAETAVTTIAREFGLTRQQVRQRLALGDLSPKVRAAWLAGEIDAEAAKAYAEGDIAAQEAYFDAPQRGYDHNGAHSIRRALLGDWVAGSDRRAKFVGADAYAAAGFELRDSLFAEEQRFFAPALEKLTREKLHAEALALTRVEKWGFALTGLDEESAAWDESADIEPDYLPGDEARLEEIRLALRELRTQIDPARLPLEREAAAIEGRAICRALPVAKRGKLGVMTELDWRGEIVITRALIPPVEDDGESFETGRPSGEEDDDDAGDETVVAAPARPSAAPAPQARPQPSEPIGKQLRTVLDETVSAALHDVCTRSVNFSLIVAVAALGAGYGVTTIDLKIHPRRNWTPARELLRQIAHVRFAQALEIVASAPFNDVTTAFCELIGASIDTSRDGALDAGLALTRIAASQSAIHGDLLKHFAPELYFHAATRQAAIDMIRDTEGQASAAEATGFKKKELAERAAIVAKDYNWLPKLLATAATPPDPEPEPATTRDARTTLQAMKDAIEADERAARIGENAKDETVMAGLVPAIHADGSLPFHAEAPADATPIEQVENFLEWACDRTDPEARVKAKTLFNAFNNWAALRGYEPMTIQLFGALMEEAGVEKHRVSAGVHYLGLTLNLPATVEEAAQ